MKPKSASLRRVVKGEDRDNYDSTLVRVESKPMQVGRVLYGRFISAYAGEPIEVGRNSFGSWRAGRKIG